MCSKRKSIDVRRSAASEGTWKVSSSGGFGNKKCVNCTHAHHKSKVGELQQGFLTGACNLWGGCLGSGFKLPYLWGHSANGGQVITSAQEVRSVDLQLKVAQPLDNGLWALQEKKKVAMESLSRCRFCRSHFCPDFSSGGSCSNQKRSATGTQIHSFPVWTHWTWTF